jgi:hypothetical protein
MKKKNTCVFSLTISVFFALSIVGTLLSIGGGTAFASTRPSIHVVANVTVPAKAVQAGKNVNAVANPNNAVSPCFPHPDYLEFLYNNSNNAICYSGDGYVGAHIVNADHLYSGNNCGWYLEYSSSLPQGKGFLTFDSNGVYDISLPSSSLITQVGIQGQNCNGSHSY